MGDDGSIRIQPDKTRDDSTESPKEIEEDGTIDSIIRFTTTAGDPPMWVWEGDDE